MVHKKETKNCSKTKVLAFMLAVITAATPTLTQAADWLPALLKPEKNLLMVNVASKGGSVTINEGEDTEQTVKIVSYGDTDFVDVYDKDDILIESIDAKENMYTYIYEMEKSIVTLDAAAEDGFQIVRVEDADEPKIGFSDPTDTFSYHVFLDGDKSVSFEFAQKPDAAKETAKRADEVAREEIEKKATRDETLSASAELVGPLAGDDTLIVDPTIPTKDHDGVGNTESDDTLLIDPAAADPAITEPAKEEPEIIEPEPSPAENTAIDSSEKAATEPAEEGIPEIMPEDTVDLDVGAVEEGSQEPTDEGESVSIPDPAENAQEEQEDDTLMIGPNGENISIGGEEDFTETSANPSADPFSEADVSSMDADLFVTARLVVLADTADTIIDPENLLSSYENIYLLQYESPEQAMQAYAYYIHAARAVEPDMELDAAADVTDPADLSDVLRENTVDMPEGAETVETSEPEENVITSDAIEVSAEVNPLGMLAEEPDSEAAQVSNKVIALIDTGASEHPNVIDRISLIDDVLEGNGHGNLMVSHITEQDPNAKILSIRAMGDNGHGMVSSVVAAIEYAMAQNVSIINLSIYAKASLSNSVLVSEVQKAIDAGITVVAAAGNAGEDVAGYVPGCVEDAWTIGAVLPDGSRRLMSNYGDLVDYYAVAGTTSEAAAKFSGYVSKHGLEAAATDATGLLFKQAGANMDVNDIGFDVTEDENTIYDAIIENYVKANANPELVGQGDMEIINIMPIFATLAQEENVPEGATIDTMNEGGSSSLLFQQIGRVPVYMMDEESPYVVAFANVMFRDKKARFQDMIVARNDEGGVTIDGWRYDKDTGLLYIPRSRFFGEDGKYYLEYIRTQILYSIADYKLNTEWDSSAIVSTTLPDGSVSTGVIAGDILMSGVSVLTERNLDVNSMVVSVNGYPIEGELYGYHPESGMLTVGFSPAVIQSIHVKAEKSSDDPDLEPGLVVTAAEGVNIDDMPAISATKVKVKDLSSLTMGYRIKTNVSMLYANTTSYDGGMSVGGTTVRSYRLREASTETELGNLGMYVQGLTNDSMLGEKVWTGLSGYYPMAIKPSTIDDDFFDFSSLDYNLHVALQCSHADVPNELDTSATSGGQWGPSEIMMRPVKLVTTGEKPYVIFGMYTSQVWTQNGVGLMKIWLEGESKEFKITIKKMAMNDSGKKKYHVALSQRSDYYSLKGAKYTIYTDKNCTTKLNSGSVAVTNRSGTASYASKDFEANKTYYVKETSKPEGGFLLRGNMWKDGKTYYASNDTNQDYQILAMRFNGNGDMMVQNEDGSWKKVTSLRSREPAVTYEITYYKREDGHQDEIDQSYEGVRLTVSHKDNGKSVVDQTEVVKDGKVRFTNLMYGVHYSVTEEPTKDDGTPVQVQDNYPKYFGFENEKALKEHKDMADRSGFFYDNTIGAYCYYWNRDKPVQIKKVSANTGITDGNSNYSFENATFTLTEQLSADEKEKNKTPRVYTFVCNANGESQAQRVLADTYTLSETKVPIGYQKAADQTVTVKKTSKDVQTFTVSDTPVTGSIKLKKKPETDAALNADGASLAGATYGVYKNAECTEWYATLVTDTNGEASISDVPLGNYWIKEATSSPGFDLDPTIYPVTVKEETDANGVTSGSVVEVTSTEPEVKGKIEINKASSLPLISNGNGCYSLAGAVYGIWTNKDCTGNAYTQVTTDVNGYAIADKLPITHYWVKEISPSPGFELDPNIHDVNITTTVPSATVSSAEYPKNDPAGISMTKIWKGKKTVTIPTLAGTQFTISYFDNTQRITTGTPLRTWVIEVKEIGEDNFAAFLSDAYLVQGSSPLYYSETGDPALPIGTYLFQETKPAAGYTLKGELKNKDGVVVATNGNPTQPLSYVTVVSATGTGGVRLQGGNEYSGFNEPVETSVQILKTNAEKKPLAGVEYELKNEAGDVVKTGVTDANGKVVFDKLYPDRYTLTELKTAAGTSLLKEPFVVDLPTRVTDAQIQQYNIDRTKVTYDPADNIYYIFDLSYGVINDVLLSMPMTGSDGLWKYGFIGMGIMAAITAGLIVNEYVKKKRRRCYKIGARR